MSEWQQLGFWSAPTAMMVIRPCDNKVLAVNNAACRFLQGEAVELLQRPISHFFSGSIAQLIVLTEEALHKGQGFSDALYLTLPQQQTIRVELSARADSIAAQPVLMLSFQDADKLALQRERAAAQQHYRSGLAHWQRVSKIFQEFEYENRLLLDAAGEGIYGVDANGLTTFVNPAAERILGWPADALIGKNMHTLIHAHHADGSHYHVGDCPIYQAFREGIVHQVEDDVFWTQSGKAIEVEYSSTPIKDNGHVVGAVIVFRDITEKKLAQQRLLDALSEVEHLKQRLEQDNAYLQHELSQEYNHHQILGKSQVIQHVLQKIELVGPTAASVLITGESGTGKELIARAIHESSQRSQRPLIRVNCAAIPSELFESEFFGHSKGAFTGATADRPGRFELADGGTLFLDEVGEIPLELQGKLLRVLQEQQFERVGESATRKVDVRIIAATNRDLRTRVAQGLFREDLFFRLNVFPIESVPLRARRDDIPLLAQHFLSKACARSNKTGLKIALSQLAVLQQYAWPGNIRELENIIERQVILAQGDTLRFDELLQQPNNTVSFAAPAETAPLSDARLKQQQRHSLLQALQQCNGKIFGADGAAHLLDIKPTTLASRLKRLGIDRRQFVKSTQKS